MRAIFALLLAIALSGCHKTYLDLRQPVYFVPRKSFWVGCDKHPLGQKVCKLRRINDVFNGVDEWLRYFNPTHRPEVFIVFSVRQVPFYAVNEPIYLAIDRIDCGKHAKACYNYGWDRETEIIFVSADDIAALMAHEFGHALGRGDNDVPKGVYSVMSYDLSSQVTWLDFVLMCRKHRECRLRPAKKQRGE